MFTLKPIQSLALSFPFLNPFIPPSYLFNSFKSNTLPLSFFHKTPISSLASIQTHSFVNRTSLASFSSYSYSYSYSSSSSSFLPSTTPLSSHFKKLSFSFQSNQMLTLIRSFAKEIIHPRRRKFRKASRGRVQIPIGGSKVGTQLMYGRFGLSVKFNTRLTAAQLEAARRVIRRKLKDMKESECWLRVFPDIPVTSKGNEVRMGKGKGTLDHYMCRVSMNRIVFEIDAPTLTSSIAKDVLTQASYRLPVPTKIIQVESKDQLGQILPAICNENKLEKVNTLV